MGNGENQKVQLKSVNQIGIVVKDANKVVEAWSVRFGIGPWRIEDRAGVDAKGRPWKARLAFANLGTVELELIQCLEGRLFHSRFLDEHGEGIHHLGVCVDDVDGEVNTAAALGMGVLFGNPGNFAYLDSGEPGGVIFELIKPRD